VSDTSSIGISFHDVMDLNVKRRGVIHRDPRAKLGVTMTELSSSDFKRFKFEAIRWIKKRPDPQERSWPFELENEHGCYSYDKERKIIQQRKTRQEKDDERKEEQELKELFKQHGLDIPE
tara:strand:- start:9395 stop:9754 length:360 start_codon:yes stop_codon:yes gene_type:complete